MKILAIFSCVFSAVVLSLAAKAITITVLIPLSLCNGVAAVITIALLGFFLVLIIVRLMQRFSLIATFPPLLFCPAIVGLILADTLSKPLGLEMHPLSMRAFIISGITFLSFVVSTQTIPNAHL